MNAKVFINYRRGDTAPYAGRLYDRLIAHFGEDQVFIDIDQIEPGEDFVEVINRKVGTCDIAIVAIGPNWLRPIDASGKRRLDDEEDFVRMEIVAALQRHIRVIPVLVGGAQMPRKQDLPEALAPLSRRNAIELSETRFHADVKRLIEAIEKSFPVAEKRVELSASPAALQPEPEKSQQDSVATPKPTTPVKSIQTTSAIPAPAPSTSSIFASKEPKVWTSKLWILASIIVLFLLTLACFLIWPRHQKAAKQGNQPLVANPPSVTPIHDSSPTASEGPTPSQETKAVEKKLVSNAYLDYSPDLARWKIRGYRGAVVALSETPPANNLTAPPFTGRKRLYGILSFGFKNKVAVILDVLDDKESQMVFVFDGDTNFSDKPVHKTVNGALPDPVEFQIEYPDGIRQKYAIRVDYPVGFVGSRGASQLQYHIASVRQGKIKLGEREYPVAISDDNADGMYSDLRATQLFVDATGDGEDGKLESLPASSAFSVAGTYYVVSDITPAGSRITVAQASRFGEVAGQIVKANTGEPLSGAKIKLSPNNASAVSESNGKYRIKAPEGEYWLLSAVLEGYVPQYLEGYRKVEAGKSLTLNVSLSPDTSATARSGFIQLAKGESYHFLSGQKSKIPVGGDFFVRFFHNELVFAANDRYQRGVEDLGDIGNVSLTQVEPRPAANYNRFGVVALPGHTYVSLAKAGEEGHYVIFRVIGLKMGEYVEIEFYYR